MMKKRLLFLLLPAASVWANQPPPQGLPVPLFFEEPVLPINLPPSLEGETELKPINLMPRPKAEPYSINEQDLQNHPALLEQLINQALVEKRWDFLADLLKVYHTTEQPDKILLAYAEGALLRSQGKYREAVAQYREILHQQPDLHYVHLDLGLMLAENKQFREATNELTQLKNRTEEASLQQIATHYQTAIDKTQAWQPEVNLQYEQTDNVNNASAQRTIEWQGRQWIKNEESLPQSARGFRYGLGVSRDINLTGNHFAFFNTGINGVHYWDKQDYNEQTARVAAGYKWRNAQQTWGMIPFFEQNWLGGERYSHLMGVSGEYSRYLNPRWQLFLNTTVFQRRYQDDSIAQRYDGHTTALGSTLAYQATPSWLLFGGVDWNNENTHEREQASTRTGVRVGMAKTFDNGLGIRTNLRYAQRHFKAPSWLVYQFTREDHEYQLNAALWHNKLSWRGFTPKINWRYEKIDSNMSGFYSRNNQQWFMSVEKTF